MRRLFLLATFVVALKANCQSWSQVGAGFNNYVNALYADTVANRLYAVGNFTLCGGDTMNRVAYWDGIQWNPMGAGFDRRVQDITMYNGEIYVTGQFTYSGSDTTNHIAKWNGTSWENVGGGLNDMGDCMYVFNNNLYVGGFFDTAGTTPCKYVAFWNGTVWSSVDTNITGQAWPIQTIYSYQNELIIGGRFTAHGNIDNIARLVNGQWQSLGGNAVGDVSSMKEINGDLYVTGNFISIDSVGALCFAIWDGSSWYAIYGPMSSGLNCIHYYNGNIILGGGGNSFVNMGWGMLSPGIADFTIATQNWTGVDSGFYGYVLDIEIMNNTLYAGGSFMQAGNDPCFHIAELDPSALSVQEQPANNLVSAFPNPANDHITFSFIGSAQQRTITIYDAMGRVIIRSETNENEVEILLSKFGEGVYYYTVTTEAEKSEAGIFIVQCEK